MSLESRLAHSAYGRASTGAPGNEDLADVAETLGPFGVQVLQGICDQVPASSSEDVVINVTQPIDLPLIEHALRPIGRKILALQPM